MFLLKSYLILSALVCRVLISFVKLRKVKMVSLTRRLRSHFDCQIWFAFRCSHSVLHFLHDESSSFLPTLLLFRLSSSIKLDAAAVHDVEDNYGDEPDPFAQLHSSFSSDARLNKPMLVWDARIE